MIENLCNLFLIFLALKICKGFKEFYQRAQSRTEPFLSVRLLSYRIVFLFL